MIDFEITTFLGVDPGLCGGLAFLDRYSSSDEDWIDTYDLPTMGVDKARCIDGQMLAQLIKRNKPSFAVVEHVNAMKGWGVGSCFRFGESFGTIRGVLAALDIPTLLVRPQVWKKQLHLPSDKAACRRRAIELFPTSSDQFRRVKDNHRAEAALMALYGAQLKQGA